MRVMEEVSRGLETAPEHISGKTPLRRSGGRIEAKYEKSVGGRVSSVWYRFIQAETPRSKYKYVRDPMDRPWN